MQLEINTHHYTEYNKQLVFMKWVVMQQHMISYFGGEYNFWDMFCTR